MCLHPAYKRGLSLSTGSLYLNHFHRNRTPAATARFSFLSLLPLYCRLPLLQDLPEYEKPPGDPVCVRERRMRQGGHHTMHMGYSTLCILFQRASSPFAGRSGTNEGGGVGQQRQRSEKIGNARARAHTHTHTRPSDDPSKLPTSLCARGVRMCVCACDALYLVTCTRPRLAPPTHIHTHIHPQIFLSHLSLSVSTPGPTHNLQARVYLMSSPSGC